MATSEIIVSGPLSSIATLREQMETEKLDEVSLTGIEEEKPNPLKPRPLGIEPLTYFIIVFAAHLSADLVHEWIKSMIKKGGHNDISTRFK